VQSIKYRHNDVTCNLIT